ncbi:hypothetical protein GAR06_01045 [Micromonospora saelicesensis]|uniref:Uncharacterized protein n=2 Tax=Micromonospora saelicesensis TaxID=285676 RepID=A0A328NK27_9ACTN|nr:hypothetical protein GAR05_02422 [Micromonospora saelicesensis]RAO27092.1 hypothetical protein PSN13_06008 [Micromonospora saelicesensis]RAO49217.1 hypothetical protein GAR06_01045 [Micromonospora saelicesensis]RAO60514.1 hypothetical protein LUPAC06_01137 [Micromonospora saelicesensis]RAO61977.1 hypothetical protein PSN01_01317 [Micromonospora saelicesensis]
MRRRRTVGLAAGRMVGMAVTVRVCHDKIRRSQMHGVQLSNLGVALQ